jgi:hypothetical protein
LRTGQRTERALHILLVAIHKPVTDVSVRTPPAEVDKKHLPTAVPARAQTVKLAGDLARRQRVAQQFAGLLKLGGRQPTVALSIDAFERVP